MTKIINVSHEVSPHETSCAFGGDFFAKDVCRYHVYRNVTHGNKAPMNYKMPKYALFNCWLIDSYKKCEECLNACKNTM